MMYRIASQANEFHEDQESVFWNTKFGWVENNYDLFTDSEHSKSTLPVGGFWEVVFMAQRITA